MTERKISTQERTRWRIGSVNVAVKSARMKDMAGLWYLEVIGESSNDVDPRYSVHFDVGEVTRKQMLGKTIDVVPDEPDFYLEVTRISRDLTVEVLELDGSATKLRVSGRVDWELDPTFEIVGWFFSEDDWQPL